MIIKSVKEESKKKKDLLHEMSRGLGIIFVVYIVILFTICIVLAMLVLPQVMTRAKTNFENYAAFQQKMHEFFPDTLPDSAKDISYYSFTGNFDKCLGVAFTLESKDYCEVISEFKEFYEEIDGDKWEKSLTDEVLNGQFSQDKSLSFLDSLAGGDLSGQQIIFYINSGSSETPISFGVLGNKKTGRIVAFYLKDAFPEN